MLTVKNYLGYSPIHGIGLFAAEDIAKDTLIWTLGPGFDQVYTEEQVEALPAEARAYLDTYAFWEKGKLIFPGDNDRFTNHDDNPNTYIEANGDVRARRDIKKDEEITGDYKEVCEQWQKKLNVR